MTRWLGIDHGGRRIGLAVGDEGGGIASPLEQLDAERDDVPDRIGELARQYEAGGVVVGWPINEDGSEGPQGRRAREFAEDLRRRTHLDVRLWDERLSSFEADQKLRGLFTRSQKRRRQDAVAAAAILEDFLRHDGPARAAQAGSNPPPSPDPSQP